MTKTNCKVFCNHKVNYEILTLPTFNAVVAMKYLVRQKKAVSTATNHCWNMYILKPKLRYNRTKISQKIWVQTILASWELVDLFCPKPRKKKVT